MKISKLFHWLYAILMFLPILVFIPNAFYYGFNKEAVAQEKTEQVPVYYPTNEVTSISDLLLDHIYHWSDNSPTLNPGGAIRVLFYVYNTTNLQEQFNISSSVTDTRILIDTGGVLCLYYGNTRIPLNSKTTDFVIKSKESNFNYASQIVNYMTYSNLLIPNGELIPVVTNMSITDSMSYAWKSVWQNDLFSWTNDTFLKEPFVYITDLFSIPSNNVLINALSYWLDISIIWLVFDVIMYVPLLTHRWLDKGIVE